MSTTRFHTFDRRYAQSPCSCRHDRCGRCRDRHPRGRYRRRNGGRNARDAAGGNGVFRACVGNARALEGTAPRRANTASMNILREMVGEQIEYRELLASIARRDLMLRYKQTVMGFGWAIFMPVLNTIIFSVIFMRVAPVETPVPYPIYAFCGLTAWNFFASTLRFALSSLTSNPSLVTKVYFPREIFPFAAVAVGLVDFAVASLVLFAMMAYYRIEIGWTVLLLPIVVLAQVILTAAVALLLAMGNLFYRDVKYLFEVVLSVAMFATSVVYPVDRVGGWLGALLALNPMTHILDAYRAVLLERQLPGPAFAASAALGVAALALSWWRFHLAEYEFAESL
ncbi:MAG: ABC transporter permease [Gammaproteobacteria bacterium]|nr:MAG: ABC transporter permease [Gammaproteobacteria bacterium]